LTIIIPAKNEAANIRKLLRSVAKQDYLKTHKVPIIIADADSTDDTRVQAFMAGVDYRLPSITIIPGGLPAVGRNAGAELATTRYILFLDADVELEDPALLTTAIDAMQAKALHCLTTDIHVAAPSTYWWSDAAYTFSNVCQRGSRFLGRPFAAGMFMLFDREAFLRLGGFREDAMFAEDYMLSRLVGWRRFRVIPGGIRTSDRRMRMGFWRLAKLFLITTLLGRRESTFTADRGYWDA
jgi:glycosyltransferase involved in cell wall biosynthesis